MPKNPDDNDNITEFPNQTTRARAPKIRKPSYGPANGPGWGGPAKGPSKGGGGRMKESPERQRVLADKRAAAEEMYVMLYDIAQDEEAPHMARIAAGGKLIEHIEGKAIQRIASTPNGETVEELRTVDPADLSLEERDALRAVAMKAISKGD